MIHPAPPTQTGRTRLTVRTVGLFRKKTILVHQTEFNGDVEKFGSRPEEYHTRNETWWLDTKPAWLLENPPTYSFEDKS